MKKRMFFAALFLALALFGQSAGTQPTIQPTIVAANQVQVQVTPAPAYIGLVVTDAAGNLHPALTLNLTVSQNAGVYTVTGVQAAPVTPVRNEVPAASATAGSWTLAHTPTATGATCWRNGVHQSPSLDYTLSGNVITSSWWMTTDVLACDYAY